MLLCSFIFWLQLIISLKLSYFEVLRLKCFSKSNTDVKTFLCDIKNASWSKKQSQMVFSITSNRFLRNMVRSIVGTLLEIGLKKRPIQDMKFIIESKDRSKAGFSVPAKGLFLTKIIYPSNIFLK